MNQLVLADTEESHLSTSFVAGCRNLSMPRFLKHPHVIRLYELLDTPSDIFMALNQETKTKCLGNIHRFLHVLGAFNLLKYNPYGQSCCFRAHSLLYLFCVLRLSR